MSIAFAQLFHVDYTNQIFPSLINNTEFLLAHIAPRDSRIVSVPRGVSLQTFAQTSHVDHNQIFSLMINFLLAHIVSAIFQELRTK